MGSGGGTVRSVEIRHASGQHLGVAVKDERGRILLAAGTSLTAGLCDALIRRGFLQVLVRDGIADDAIPQDALSAETRQIATQTARHCFDNLSQGDRPPLTAVMTAVDRIVEDLCESGNAVLEFSTLRSVSDYTYMHSVNVCVYALLIGQSLGVVGAELRCLGSGALLHDVGKILCADLCNKAGPLTAEDWVRVKQHPVDGFEMLRQHRELHLFAAHIAYQHHERMDGSGYPRGLTGEQMLPFARVVAVADVFDAMTSDRPHARAKRPSEAMVAVREGSGPAFDPEVVRAFMRRIAIYPTGTPVLLADGTVAVVVDQSAESGQPIVRLLGRAGRRHRTEEQVSAIGDRAITEVLAQWPRWLDAAIATG